MNKAAQAYLKTKVSTTDQGHLLLMLYDGALNYLQQARDKMLAKDYAAKGVLISKVIDIVNELSGSLNLEKGGSLAENLNNLYFLCTARLLQANLKMNVEQLDSVGTILTGLRNAYAQILQTPEAQKASRQIASQLRPDANVVQHAPIPVSQPLHRMPMNIGKMQARAAYGQNAQATAPATAPAAAPAAPAQQHARVTQMPRPQVAQAPAGMAVTPAGNGDTVPAAKPVAPTAAPAAAPAGGAMSGLAASAQMFQKMSAYRKM